MRLQVCFNADPDPFHILYFHTDHGPDPDPHSCSVYIYITVYNYFVVQGSVVEDPDPAN